MEVYQATHKEHTVRVYFLFYDASAEEQSYLTSLRREKEALELLIRDIVVSGLFVRQNFFITKGSELLF